MNGSRPSVAPGDTGCGENGGQRTAVRRAVLSFGRTRLRSFPWRATRDPWAILVSEVMLQQTSPGRVIDAYQRFLQRFPSPAACAAAAVGDVVRAWTGLGYNRRAVNLHRAATTVVDRHGGVVPPDLDALCALPGIGPYTARAVLAFAYESDVAVVDVNVARVLARAVVGEAMTVPRAQAVADWLVPRGRAWLWNQSLMEIGAVFCSARAPGCEPCPLRSRCVWTGSGRPSPDPAAVRSKPTVFAGSDREGRGRLVDALRQGPVAPGRLAAACGWPDDGGRAQLMAERLVSEGLARRRRGGALVLP